MRPAPPCSLEPRRALLSFILPALVLSRPGVYHYDPPLRVQEIAAVGYHQINVEGAKTAMKLAHCPLTKYTVPSMSGTCCPGSIYSALSNTSDRLLE